MCLYESRSTIDVNDKGLEAGRFWKVRVGVNGCRRLLYRIIAAMMKANFGLVGVSLLPVIVHS